MGLSFLAPAFLAGLLALAVPILVHMIQRERSQTVPFPSLMFLRKIPYRSVRRQRIRHLLLLILRCAALVLLAAAFARPFLDRPLEAAGGVLGAREVVILLDRSYSMGYGDRWQRAQSAAGDALDGMGPDDRASLVLFDAGARAVTEPTSDRARLRASLNAAAPGHGATRYGPALQLAQRLLEPSNLPRQEVVLITDFQKTGWEGQQEVRLPPGVTLTPVDVGGPGASNVLVTGVTFAREYVGGRERVTATARLANQGEAAVEGLAVALELDGRELQSRPLDLEPNGAGSVTFDAFTLPQSAVRGRVVAGRDALPVDNVFHFALSPGQAVSVLVVERPGSAERGLYLRRALEIGDRPPFRVELRRTTQLAAGDVGGRAVVVLNDVPVPGGDAGRRLREFVEAGGGLLVVLGERTAPGAWNQAGAELLPGPVGAPVDRPAGRGGTLAWMDYGHPVFELFSAPRSGDFSAARFFRYRRLDAPGDTGVIARFDDGAAALAEKTLGRGRVLVWTSTLDNYWTDLAVQPVFLPFIHQLSRHAAGYTEARPWHTVGQVVDLSGRSVGDDGAAALAAAGDLPAGAPVVAVAPSGERTTLRVPDAPSVLELMEQGFYELREPGAGGAVLQSLAVNLDLAESNLARVDPAELAAAVTAAGSGGARAAAAGTLTREDHERRQALWRYLLLAALLLLATETVLSNRLSRVAR